MTDNNPFAPPRADVRDTPMQRGRPVWVWVISIFYLFGAFSSVLSYAMIYSGKLPMTEQQSQYMANLTIVDHFLTAVILGTNIVAAVLLFRLRRLSAYLFPAGLALGLLVTAWHALARGWANALNGAGVVGAAIGWVVSIVVCFYVWRLTNKGILK